MAKTDQAILQNSAQADQDGEIFDIDNAETAVVQAIGSFTATLTFQVSLDRTNWANLGMTAIVDGTTVSATATAAGGFRADVKGWRFLRVPISGLSGGSVTVKAARYQAE